MRNAWTGALALVIALRAGAAVGGCETTIDVRGGIFVYNNTLVESGQVEVVVDRKGVWINGEWIVDIRPPWSYVKDSDRAPYAANPYCAALISNTVSLDSAIVATKQAERQAYRKVGALLASMKSRADLPAVKAQVESDESLRPFVRQVFWAEENGNQANQDPGYQDWGGGYYHVPLGCASDAQLPTVEESMQKWCGIVEGYRRRFEREAPPFRAVILQGGSEGFLSGEIRDELLNRVRTEVARHRTMGGR